MVKILAQEIEDGYENLAVGNIFGHSVLPYIVIFSAKTPLTLSDPSSQPLSANLEAGLEPGGVKH